MSKYFNLNKFYNSYLFKTNFKFEFKESNPKPKFD